VVQPWFRDSAEFLRATGDGTVGGGDRGDLAILGQVDADVTGLVDGAFEDDLAGIVDHGAPGPGEEGAVRQLVTGSGNIVQLAVGGRPDEDTLRGVTLRIGHLGGEGGVILIVDAGPGTAFGE